MLSPALHLDAGNDDDGEQCRSLDPLCLPRGVQLFSLPSGRLEKRGGHTQGSGHQVYAHWGRHLRRDALRPCIALGSNLYDEPRGASTDPALGNEQTAFPLRPSSHSVGVLFQTRSLPLPHLGPNGLPRSAESGCSVHCDSHESGCCGCSCTPRGFSRGEQSPPDPGAGDSGDRLDDFWQSCRPAPEGSETALRLLGRCARRVHPRRNPEHGPKKGTRVRFSTPLRTSP